MLSTDKLFDILPYAVDIYEKIEIDKYIEESKKKYKKNPVSQMQAGIDLFKYVLKGSGKIKKEIITVVSIIQGKSYEEIAAQNFLHTAMSLKEIFTDKETVDFFKSAMQ
jgi:hypothetical protein